MHDGTLIHDQRNELFTRTSMKEEKHMIGLGAVPGEDVLRSQPQQPAIWVVDDNEHFANALASFIDQLTGARRTTCFDSAEGAIAKLESGTNPPGVILMDVEMPGMNGLDALAAVKHLAPGCRIYMVTGAESTHRRRIAIERGANDYLLKLDISREKLLEIIA